MSYSFDKPRSVWGEQADSYSSVLDELYADSDDVESSVLVPVDNFDVEEIL